MCTNSFDISKNLLIKLMKYNILSSFFSISESKIILKTVYCIDEIGLTIQNFYLHLHKTRLKFVLVKKNKT